MSRNHETDHPVKVEERDGAGWRDDVLLLAVVIAFLALVVYPFTSGSYIGPAVTFLIGAVGMASTAFLMSREKRSTLAYGAPIMACAVLIGAGCFGAAFHAVTTYFPHLGVPDLNAQIRDNAAVIAGEVAPELAGCEYVDRDKAACGRAAKIKVATRALQVAPTLADQYHVDAKAVADDIVRSALAGLPNDVQTR